MKSLQVTAFAMRFCHDGIIRIAQDLGFGVNDKALHFIVLGMMGMVIFACCYALGTCLRRKHTNIIAFVSSFVAVVAIAIAIEIIQGATKSVNVELADIVYGIIGFICFFGIYRFVCCMFKIIQKACTEMKSSGFGGMHMEK